MNGTCGKSSTTCVLPASCPPVVVQVRFSVMSLWMMLRQWLVENLSPMNTLVRTLGRHCFKSRGDSYAMYGWAPQLSYQGGIGPSTLTSHMCLLLLCLALQTTADGLYVRSTTSYWSLRFTIDTPLPLTSTAMDGLALLSEAAATLPGRLTAHAGLYQWDISNCHVAPPALQLAQQASMCSVPLMYLLACLYVCRCCGQPECGCTGGSTEVRLEPECHTPGECINRSKLATKPETTNHSFLIVLAVAKQLLMQGIHSKALVQPSHM